MSENRPSAATLPEVVCKEAAQLIRKRGWCRGYRREKDSSLCVMGALSLVITGDEWTDSRALGEHPAVRLVLSRMGPATDNDPPCDPSYRRIECWNDSVARRLGDVLSLLEGE
jgi:hypothetical protein